MSAPATSHDLPQGTTVVPLSRARGRACPVCEGPALWTVGPDARSCDEHLAAVLREVRAAADGFLPPLVLPIGGVR